MCNFFKPWEEFHMGFSSHLFLPGSIPSPSPLSLPLYCTYIQVFLKGHIYSLNNTLPSAGLRWTCLFWVFSRLLWKQLRPAFVTRTSVTWATKTRHYWSTFIQDFPGLPASHRACRRPTPCMMALGSQGAGRYRKGQSCQPGHPSQLFPWTQHRIRVIDRVLWDSPGSSLGLGIPTDLEGSLPGRR